MIGDVLSILSFFKTCFVGVELDQEGPAQSPHVSITTSRTAAKALIFNSQCVFRFIFFWQRVQKFSRHA